MPLPSHHRGQSQDESTLAEPGQGWLASSHVAPWLKLQRARRRTMEGPPPVRASAWSMITCAQTTGGGGAIGGPPRRSRVGETVQKAHRTPQGRRGAQNSWGGGGVEYHPQPHHNRAFSAQEGGRAPPRRRVQTCRALPRPGRTYHCGESMETSPTTIMGRTCQGESRTTPYSKVVGES